MTATTSLLRPVGHVERLAAMRIALFGYVVVTLVVPGGSVSLATATTLASLPGEIRVPPMGWQWMSTLAGPVLTDDLRPVTVTVLGVVVGIAAVAAMVGWRFRVSAWIATAALLPYVGEMHSWGKVNHNHHLVWVAALLAASGAADVWSVDARRATDTPPRTSRRHGLPLLATWVLLGVVYLFPGIAKLASLGTPYSFVDNLRNNVLVKQAVLEPDPPLAAWVAGLPDALLVTVAWSVIVFELAAIALLLHDRTPTLVLGLGVAFHLSTWLVLGIGFWSLLPLYVSLLPWERLRGRGPPCEPRTDELPPIAMRITAAVVVVPVIVVAATGTEDAWPYARHPSFVSVSAPVVASLAIEVDGSTVMTPDAFDRVAAANARGIAALVASTPSVAQRVLAALDSSGRFADVDPDSLSLRRQVFGITPDGRREEVPFIDEPITP